ncbi:MAG: hypothetical protein OXH63_09960 [Gemmatimonadetes bacterium]|nr:hypothetical protein [Gemmatimonadota bacterium]
MGKAVAEITPKELDDHPFLLGEMTRYRVLVIQDSPDRMAIRLDAPMGHDAYDICVYVAKKDKLLALANDIIQCIQRHQRKIHA